MFRKRYCYLAISVFVLSLSFNSPVRSANPYWIERVNISSAGAESAADSSGASISPDNRFVGFQSIASNLVPSDTNATNDNFLHDLLTGETNRVSLSGTALQANGASFRRPALSWNAEYIAFSSSANNLVANDTNGREDIFLRERKTGHIIRVSVSPQGVDANQNSYGVSITPDGRWIAFKSLASNLVANDTNNAPDIFVYDRLTDQLERVNLSSAEEQAIDPSAGAPSDYPVGISDSGQFVVFDSRATNLVPNDTNLEPDIFVRDRQLGTTRRVSVSSTGVQANNDSLHPAISANGQFVVFVSLATNLVPNDTNTSFDVFVHNLLTHTTERVNISSEGNQASVGGDWAASISGDGRFVTFNSGAANLVENDTNGTTDIFVRDRINNLTALVSVSADGTQANNSSGIGSGREPIISPDGNYILFTSDASNLVPGDTNGKEDVFIARNPLADIPVLDAPIRNYYTALPFTLSWSAISGAQGYQLQINPTSDFSAPMTQDIELDANTLELSITDLAPSIYYWRVRAKKADGQWGLWSAYDSFQLALPS